MFGVIKPERKLFGLNPSSCVSGRPFLWVCLDFWPLRIREQNTLTTN